MEPLQQDAVPLPVLRALALSLLLETVLPLLNRPAEELPELHAPDVESPELEVELWRLLQRRCDELSAHVLRLPVLGSFESAFQVQAMRTGTTAESWDSPFEPRTRRR
jgi:hypothetical protein